MIRIVAAVLVSWALLVPSAALAAGDGELPDECLVVDRDGQLPTCIENSDGTWDTVYPSASTDDGFFGVFALVAIVGLVVGGGVTVYKVSMARSMARRSGMSEGDATAMTLLDEDGLSATYLAANLRQPPSASPAPDAAPASSAARLAELRSLLDGGLITQAEYDDRRKAIIDSV